MKSLHLVQKSDVDVTWWVLQDENKKELLRNRTKADVLERSIKLCKELATVKNPLSLKIHGKDGKIKSERTYPKSADPKKSRG
jgi:hypothetical protein